MKEKITKKVACFFAFIAILFFQPFISHAQWSPNNMGLVTSNISVYGLAVDGTNIVVSNSYFGAGSGINNNSIYYATNSGVNFNACPQIVYTDFSGIHPSLITSPVSCSGKLFVGAQNPEGASASSTAGSGVYVSSDHGHTWTQTAETNMVDAICSDGTTLYADVLTSSSSFMGVYKSTDNGATWTVTGFTKGFSHMLVNHGVIYADGAVSTTNGNTWVYPTVFGVGAFSHSAIDCRGYAMLGGAVYIATQSLGICRSTDDGSTWTQVLSTGAECICKAGNALLAGIGSGTGAGIDKSDANGNSWVPVNGFGSLVPFRDFVFVAANNQFAVAATNNNGFTLYPNDSIVYVATLSSLGISAGIHSPEELSAQINIFPNPATDKFTLQRGALQGDLTVEVTDITGRRISVNNYRSDPGDIIFKVGDISGGMYLLNISNGDFSTIKKIIITR